MGKRDAGFTSHNFSYVKFEKWSSTLTSVLDKLLSEASMPVSAVLSLNSSS